MDSTSSGSPTASPTGAIRTRTKSAGSIAKRACDQCKFRKIKVCQDPKKKETPTRAPIGRLLASARGEI